LRGPNFTKIEEDIGRSLTLNEFVSDLRYVAAFSNASASNSIGVENYVKFYTFYAPTCKE